MPRRLGSSARAEGGLEPVRPVRPGGRALAEQDDDLRVESVHDAGERATEQVPGLAEDLGRARVARVGGGAQSGDAGRRRR